MKKWKNKLITHDEAALLVKDGQSIMCGGFGETGYPYEMIKALHRTDRKHLTIIGSDGGMEGDPKGAFYVDGQVDKLVITYTGLNPVVSQAHIDGKLDVEWVPQGTFVERIRCGGFGLGGFLTPTGIGTMVEEGKQVLELDGKKYLLEKPLRADVAFVKAAAADKFGNLIFEGAARTYNPYMAMAADLVIAEVDEVVEVGELEQNFIMLSGIFVDYIVDNRQAVDPYILKGVRQ